MKPVLFCTYLLSLLTAAPLCAQEPAHPLAPAIPRETGASERALLFRSELQLSKGQFETAEAILRPILPAATVGVFVEEADVPSGRLADYRKAVQNALDAWNIVLAGTTKFQLTPKEEGAGLLLQFVADLRQGVNGEFTHFCIQEQMERQNRDGTKVLTYRCFRVRLSVSTPEPGQIHSPASITHLAGQALGTYLGLDSSENAADIMGLDTHDNKVALIPSDADVQHVRAIQQTRLHLVELAKKRIAPYLPRPVFAPEKNDVDIGEIWRGEKAHFVFNIKNTGDAPLEITAKPNCGCTVAKYDKTIPPGGTGKIEADMRTSSFKGRTAKTITVTSNDPDKPQLSLRILANIRPLVEITSAPGVLPLKSEAPTIKEFQVKVGGPEPVKVTRVACSAPFATATLEPAGESVYKIVLTVQPEAPMGRSMVRLTAFSDSKLEPQSSLTVICEKGIIATPVGVYMGAIAPKTPMPVKQTVLIARHDGDFHIQKLTAEDPKLEVAQETVQDGKQYRLTLTYRGGWAEGPIRSKVIVETDDPRQPKIEITVLAQVLPATQVSRP